MRRLLRSLRCTGPLWTRLEGRAMRDKSYGTAVVEGVKAVVHCRHPAILTAAAIGSVLFQELWTLIARNKAAGGATI